MLLAGVGKGKVTLGNVWADSSYQVTNILPVCAYQQSHPQVFTPEEWKHMLAQALHVNIHSTNAQIPKENSPPTFRLQVCKQHLTAYVNTRWLSKKQAWNTEHARNTQERQKTQAQWFCPYDILRWLNWGSHCCRKRGNALPHGGKDRRRCATRLGKHNLAKLPKVCTESGWLNFKLVIPKDLRVKPTPVPGTNWIYLVNCQSTSSW